MTDAVSDLSSSPSCELKITAEIVTVVLKWTSLQDHASKEASKPSKKRNLSFSNHSMTYGRVLKERGQMVQVV